MDQSRVCLYCSKEQQWKWSGKKLKDGSKVYVDAHNGRWAGKRCPSCERLRVHAAIRCDRFEKDQIIRHLSEEGYKIISSTLPLIVEKEKTRYQVGIRRAYAKEGNIVLESPNDPNADLHVLVFESIRAYTSEELKPLMPYVGVYSKRDNTKKMTQAEQPESRGKREEWTGESPTHFLSTPNDVSPNH